MNVEHLVELSPGPGDDYTLILADHVLDMSQKARWKQGDEQGGWGLRKSHDNVWTDGGTGLRRKEIALFDKKPTVHVKKQAFDNPKGRVPWAQPKPGVQMSLRKPLSLVALLAVAALAACSDITGPQPSGWCPITGSSGTCEGGVTAQK
jgi:hypothetical protein